MSNRSIFPEGVEVHQRHLANTEAQRAASDKQIVVDTATGGVVSGLTITVGGTNTRVSIAAGSAYAPNGEFMTLALSQTNVSLASDTLGVINYVILMYDEVQSQPESHETDGTTRNTKATVAPRLVILTEAQHAALPVNATALSANDQQRGAIIGKVVANGPAVALTDGSIQNATPFPEALTSTQPVNITGVTIISIDSVTDVGIGTISFNFGTTALTWSAPGDAAGAPVVLTMSQLITLTSANGRTILVKIAFASIPSSNKSDTIVITNIYTQNVKRFSAIDDQHRSFLGSGEPTAVNPHGMTLNDLSPGAVGTIEDHQDVQHHNGLARFNNPNTLLMTVVPSIGVDALQIPDFVAGDYAYINGRKITEIADATDNTWGVPEGTEASTWGVYLDHDAVITKIKRTAFLGSTSLNNKLQIVNMSEGLTGPISIQWTSAGLISVLGGPTKTAPVNNAVLRLDFGNNIDYVDVFVRGSSTPGVTETDPVTVAAGPNMEEHIILGYVCWDGATGTLGYGDPGSGGPPNLIYDLRPFGNMGTDEMSDSAGYTPPADLAYYGLGDGVLIETEGHEFSAVNLRSAETAAANDFVLTALAYPSISMAGGIAIVGGKVFHMFAHTFTVQASNTNRMYIDSRGAYQVSTNTWDAIAGQSDGKPIIRLAEIVIDGANAEVSRADRRIFSSAKHSVSGGVVGLDKDRQASWSTTSTLSGGTALTVSGVGAATGGATISGTGGGVIGACIGATGVGVSGATFGTGSAVKGQSIGGGVGVEGVGSAIGASTGVKGTGTGASFGVEGIGGPTNNSTGARFTSSATNGNGLSAAGSGTGYGILADGGASSSLAAITGQGHASNPSGNGVRGLGTGQGSGVYGTGGVTAFSAGGYFDNGGTNGVGAVGFGKGTEPGIRGMGLGASGGPGGEFLGAPSKYGINVVGGSSAVGAFIQGGSSANGCEITGGSGATGLSVTGVVGDGALIQGGSGGRALALSNFSASNPALVINTPSGYTTAIQADGWIDLDGSQFPASFSSPKNSITKQNILKAYLLCGFTTAGFATILDEYNINGISTHNIVANRVEVSFDEDIGEFASAGTTILTANAANILTITRNGGNVFTSNDVNRFITIDGTLGNSGTWRISAFVDANTVQADTGVAGVVNDGVAKNWVIATERYTICCDASDESQSSLLAANSYFPKTLNKTRGGFSFFVRLSTGGLAPIDATMRLTRMSFHIYGIQP